MLSNTIAIFSSLFDSVVTASHANLFVRLGKVDVMVEQLAAQVLATQSSEGPWQAINREDRERARKYAMRMLMVHVRCKCQWSMSGESEIARIRQLVDYICIW